MPSTDDDRTPRQVRSVERLAALTDAAGRLLIDEGPAAVTYRRVATAAGLPEGTASYYFRTRTALYAAAVEAAEDQRTNAARERAESLEPGSRTSTQIARLLIEVAYAPHVEADVVVRRLEPMLAATRDPALRSLMAESRPRLLDALATVLERSRRPALASADVELLAQVVDAALLYASGSGSDDVIGAATATVARILDLLAPQAVT